jgi:hypothetical protein
MKKKKMTTKPTLINDFEASNKEGNELTSVFEELITEFVECSCKLYDSTQVEHLLTGTLSSMCAENRLRNAVDKKKQTSKTH